jgi:ppGpp synthetase/RelA/SpoT-type nucleotidyltranferase
MKPKPQNKLLQWVKNQVDKYSTVAARYEEMANIIQLIFERVKKRYNLEAIIQVRRKKIPSFSEKILRKKSKYINPVCQLTDLCGARIITALPSEVKRVCHFIEKHFEIDWENSVDVSQRHQLAEFGYRSVHYIVSFKKGAFTHHEFGDIKISKMVYPDPKCPMKAEIQVRTLLEHAWAVFSHDKMYKKAFKIPDKWVRNLAALAAILEETDNSFEKIQMELENYTSNYGAYMTNEQIIEEINILKTVLQHGKNDLDLVYRIGKLEVTLGNWDNAIELFSQYKDSGYPPILRELGISLCQKYKKHPRNAEFKQGQKYLEEVVKKNNKDVDAIASLAGTWKNIDNKKVTSLYRQAFEADPSNPYPLGNYLEYQIASQKDLSLVALTSPLIETAIKKCNSHAEVGINLPWVYYDIGKFYLLQNKTFKSFDAYAKAITLSTAEFMIASSINSLARLSVVKNQLPGWEWIYRALVLGKGIKFPSPQSKKELREWIAEGENPIKGPVIIIAGGCQEREEEKILNYRQILLDAFKDFKGTVISGGTCQGICKLAGDVSETYPAAITTIGYVPSSIPAEVTVEKDKRRVNEIRRTKGNGFSPLEPLQYWTDILASEIKVSDVKVVGINGGEIAAAEYKIALTLGARVAFLKDSGGEASKLFEDNHWKKLDQFLPIPADAMTLKSFIGPTKPKINNKIRETIARAVHENYRSIQSEGMKLQDPSLVEWNDLQENLKESNRHMADFIFETLKQIDCVVKIAKHGEVQKIELNKDEINKLAEMEHGRWNVERLLDGWRWGEKKDIPERINPYLVGWSELPEKVKKWNRETVRKIPEYLAEAGFEIKRLEKE